MTNDYAAIITTVIVAVLVIGAIQFYTFTKRCFLALIEYMPQMVEVERKVLDCLRTGTEPPQELLTKLIWPATGLIRLH
ncbi:hypothetical protein [Streptomyces sp. NRRL S-1448]|uniref:hypothetical protein n=1 Tax=Streptomyces sp. NRRL S-1448 TaxID=1463883 RepID=UPI0004BEBF88|nr:hypothetical protein [Streptomyces sp. NRRL S-1448]